MAEIDWSEHPIMASAYQIGTFGTVSGWIYCTNVNCAWPGTNVGEPAGIVVAKRNHNKWLRDNG